MIDKKEQKREYDKAYASTHREQIRAYGKAWYLIHKERLKGCQRDYYSTHKEPKKAYSKAYRLIHKERINAYGKTYKLIHKEQYYEHVKRYGKTPKGKINNANYRARRRTFGFIPLNQWFNGSHGHHIDRGRVIYIPKELHRSIWHSVLQNRGMNKINLAAVRFLKTNELKLFY